jgi:transposase
MQLLYKRFKEKQKMNKRPRRNHTPTFKAKVTLEALKGEQKIVELSRRYQIHPNQITEWKRQLLEHAADVFNKNRKLKRRPDLNDLQDGIGQQSTENDFLSCPVGRLGEAITKR